MPRPRPKKRASKRAPSSRIKRPSRRRRIISPKQAALDALSAGTFTVSETKGPPRPEPTSLLHGEHPRLTEAKIVVPWSRGWKETPLRPGTKLRLVAELRGECGSYLFGLRDPVSREAMCFHWLDHGLSGCRNSIVESRPPAIWATPAGAHVYEIEWNAGEVFFYVCGQLVHRSAPAPTAPHVAEVFTGSRGEIALHEVSATDIATGVTTYIVGAPEPAAAGTATTPAPATATAAAPGAAPTAVPEGAPAPANATEGQEGGPAVG